MDLNYQEYGDGPPILVLHGLFGSARNWTMIAKALADDHNVIAVDMPNHGDSPWTEQMDYHHMAEAVRDFMNDKKLEGAAVLGHSMGGKAAMILALEESEHVGGLIVADIAPVDYPHTFLPFIEAMKKVDLEKAKSKSDVDDALKDAIGDQMVRGFLLQNLKREDGRLAWRINLDVLEDDMEHISAFPDLPGDCTYEGKALFIGGGESSYITTDHHEDIRRLFPHAEIDYIPDADHWLHADQPDAFTKRVKDFMAEL